MEKNIIKPYSEDKVNEHALKVGGKRNLREVEIETEDGEVFVYLIKRPSRSVMQAVTHAESKKDTDGIQKLMLGCVLEGDKDAYENDGSIYVKLLESVGKLLHTSKVSLKKL